MLALSRRAAFGTTVSVAMGLHAVAALGLAAAMTSPKVSDSVASAKPVMEVRWITLAAPSSGIPTAPSTPEPSVPMRAATAATVPATQTSAAPDRGPVFLGSGEVDEPARPAAAWAIDADDLAALGIQRIVFDTWIDADASVFRLRVIDMEPSSTASLASLVEARLAATPMVAARKGGQPVAHQQRIDLTWQQAVGRPG